MRYLPFLFWIAMAGAVALVGNCATGATRWPGERALAKLCQEYGVCL